MTKLWIMQVWKVLNINQVQGKQYETYTSRSRRGSQHLFVIWCHNFKDTFTTLGLLIILVSQRLGIKNFSDICLLIRSLYHITSLYLNEMNYWRQNIYFRNEKATSFLLFIFLYLTQILKKTTFLIGANTLFSFFPCARFIFGRICDCHTNLVSHMMRIWPKIYAFFIMYLFLMVNAAKTHQWAGIFDCYTIYVTILPIL